MTEKQLKHLNRAELLELLIIQTREVEKLRQQIQELEQQLAERELKMNQAGSLAEAVLAVNRVVDAAQAAADQYLENIQRMESESRIASEWIVQAALADARRIRQAAEDGLKTEPEGVGST